MSTLIDLKDKVYGRLTVIERRGSNRFKKALWLCKCECGKETIVESTNLRNGHTRSCGCLMGGYNKLSYGVAAFNVLYGEMKRGATKRNLVWKLNKEYVLDITKRPCHYCGIGPKKSLAGGKSQSFNGDYFYNGIDRINNNKGYTTNNTVPCCEDCNRAKLTRTASQFLTWTKKINIYQEGVFCP